MSLNSNLPRRGDGICLLSLDAGGQRALSQLKILAEMMYRLNYEAREDHMNRPCTVFDMIGGTGSGGFIAILLVIIGLTAQQALEEFAELSAVVLEARAVEPQSRTTALREYIDRLMKKYFISTDMRLMDQNDRSNGCKLLVPISCKQDVGMRYTLRNYIVRHEQALNITVVEALLATLATPPLFSSTSILNDSETMEIMGADMTLSNPAGEIIADAHAVFTPEAQVACLLSLGCGRASAIVAPEDHILASWNRFLEMLATDSEQLARALDSQMGHLGLYYRLSITTLFEGAVASGSGSSLSHAAVYLSDPSVSRKLDSCIESLKTRDGVASLEQLRHSGGESVLPPALPPLTRTFVMRKEPWEFIEKVMLGDGETEKGDGPRMLAVTGIGGCGKTQIVLKFIRVHESKFASRFFIDGSSRTRIRADILRHVRSLGTEHSQKEFKECLLFLAQPSTEGPRLIFYDNVDDPDLDLAPLIPPGDACAIIITSRNWSISELCPEAHLELDVMSIDEAVELLLHNPNRSAVIGDQDREDAICIAQALGCLPIALTQARSYMYQTKCSGKEYLQRLQSKQDKLLAKPMKNQRDMRYNSTYAAFDASFERLTPGTQRLLWLLSYFHWSKFPLKLVTVAAKYEFCHRQTTFIEDGDEFRVGREVLGDLFLLEGAWSIENLEETVVSLQNYSLVTLVRGVDTTLVQMHPLAHGWVHHCIPEEGRARFRAAAVLLLALGAREEYTPSAQYLASHVLHMTPLWDQLHINDAGAFGHILHGAGLFEGASQLQGRVVIELRRENSIRIRSLSTALTALALTYYGSGRLKETEALEEEALKLLKDSVGDRDPETIVASIRLGVTYCDLGRLKEAEALQLEVQRISKEVLGESDSRTIKATNCLATTYRDLGKLKQAEELQVEVLKLTNKVLGARHVATLWASGNLANTYRLLGRPIEAEKLEIAVLNLRKEMFGERHPDTIMALNNLSLTYRALGRMEEALELQVEVMRFRKEVLGERHRNTLDSIEMLGTTYHHLGRLGEAVALLTELLRLRKEILGDRHPATLSAANNLAYTLRNVGRLEEAETMQVETLSLMRVELGEEHFDTTNAMLTLAEIYESRRKKNEALVLLAEAAVKISEYLGNKHAQYLECQEIEARVRRLEDSPTPLVVPSSDVTSTPKEKTIPPSKEKVLIYERVEPTPLHRKKRSLFCCF